MLKNDICKEVISILKEVIEDEKKLPNTFEEDFSDYIDSIEFVMLVVAIENRYNIRINDNDFDIDNACSINSIAELILKYMNNHF